jgi:hypothetical protein
LGVALVGVPRQLVALWPRGSCLLRPVHAVIAAAERIGRTQA